MQQVILQNYKHKQLVVDAIAGSYNLVANYLLHIQIVGASSIVFSS